MSYTAVIQSFLKGHEKDKNLDVPRLIRAVQTFEDILNEHNTHKRDPHATAARLIDPTREAIRAGLDKKSFEVVISVIHATGVCPDGERVIAMFKRNLGLS